MSAVQAVPKEHKKGCIQVSTHSRKFVFVDLTKHMLASGEPTVELTGLGAAISECVAVVEMLKNQGMINVDRILTSRGVDGSRRANTDQITIIVSKTAEFDALFSEQMARVKEHKDRVAEAAAGGTEEVGATAVPAATAKGNGDTEA